MSGHRRRPVTGTRSESSRRRAAARSPGRPSPLPPAARLDGDRGPGETDPARPPHPLAVAAARAAVLWLMMMMMMMMIMMMMMMMMMMMR
jgi:hypothetical protein